MKKVSGEKDHCHETLAKSSATSRMKSVVLYAQRQESQWARRQQDPAERHSRRGSIQLSIRVAVEGDGAVAMTK